MAIRDHQRAIGGTQAQTEAHAYRQRIEQPFAQRAVGRHGREMAHQPALALAVRQLRVPLSCTVQLEHGPAARESKAHVVETTCNARARAAELALPAASRRAAEEAHDLFMLLGRLGRFVPAREYVRPHVVRMLHELDGRVRRQVEQRSNEACTHNARAAVTAHAVD